MARPSIWTHRKFVRLCRLLGAEYKAIGVLECIWKNAYTDGEELIGSSEDVEFLVGWDGEPGACAAALVDSGFVDVSDNGGLRVHDLMDHAPDYVRKRRTRELERRAKADNDRSLSDIDYPPAPAPAPIKKKSKKKSPAKKKPARTGGTGSGSRKENSRTIFLPPSLDEVNERIREKSYHFDAVRFIAFYQSKNWMVGKNKMVDWHAACTTWEERWKEENPGGGESGLEKTCNALARRFDCLPSDIEQFYESQGFTPNSREEVYEWLKAN